MVRFDVHLHVVGQAVGAEEIDAGRAIEVVLVLGRLLGLGLEVELPLEADLPGVIDGHVHEPRQVLELALHVGVPEGLVAFASAPEDIALATQLLGHLQGLLDLRRGVGEGIGIGAGGGPMHETGVAEEIGRAPQQLDARPLHFLLDHLDHRVQILVGLGQRTALGGDVAVVEAEEGGGQLLDELEGHADPLLGVVDVVAAAFPGPQHRGRTEGVRTAAAHRVPVGDAEAEMVLHRLAGHDFRLVVVAESQGILRLRAFVADLLDFRKSGHDGFQRQTV